SASRNISRSRQSLVTRPRTVGADASRTSRSSKVHAQRGHQNQAFQFNIHANNKTLPGGSPMRKIASLTFGATCLLSGWAFAADVNLPKTLVWTSFDTGSLGYNQSIAVGKALQDAYGIS